jgi:predicted O-methyltransferase YrrM
MHALKPWLTRLLGLDAGAQAQLATAQARLGALRKRMGMFPPGHFYSPIPDLEQVRKDEAAIWPIPERVVAGIDLHEERQLELLQAFAEFHAELPFPKSKNESLRYYFENPAYGCSDAIILYCMLRYWRPRRVIEVGSGFSSCVVLDTNELCFNGAMEMTFIDPFPELLLSLIKEQDNGRITVLASGLQEVDLSAFDALGRNDFLFIDSTHVSKIGSDVNALFFRILPRLQPGVVVHFHDVFYPFEYPRDWTYQGISWNEDYILRAFLQYNDAFQILFFSSFLKHFHEDLFRRSLPLCFEDQGGCLWIQKQ